MRQYERSTTRTFSNEHLQQSESSTIRKLYNQGQHVEICNQKLYIEGKHVDTCDLNHDIQTLQACVYRVTSETHRRQSDHSREWCSYCTLAANPITHAQGYFRNTLQPIRSLTRMMQLLHACSQSDHSREWCSHYTLACDWPWWSNHYLLRRALSRTVSFGCRSAVTIVHVTLRTKR